MHTLKKYAELAGIAVLFAICGVGSSELFGRHGFAVLALGTPLPFSALFAALCLRTLKALWVLPLLIGVWIVSFYGGIVVADPSNMGESHYVAMGIAGMAGALGVTLAGSIVQPRLRTSGALIGAGIAGIIGGLAFGPSMPSVQEGHELPKSAEFLVLLSLYSFAIWQSLVGTYLYWVCSRKQEPVAESAEFHLG